MRRGIGRLRAGGSSGDADANAWAAAVTANGGTYSAATLAAVTVFTVSAKASGYWTKLNRINLFCGNQLAAALVPLKVGGGSATDTNNNFVNGDYTEATGLTGNGSTKYLATGLIPSTSLTLNDTHLSVYNRSASAVGGAVAIGSGSGAVIHKAYLINSDGGLYSQQYDITPGSGALVVGGVAAPYGLLVASRTSSASHAVYKAGSSIGSNAATGGALPALGMFVFAVNGSGSPSEFTSHIFAAYSIGSGLTAGDVTAYNTHMTTFQTALSRNV